MALSERTFGVEIECTYGAPPSGASNVYQRLGWAHRDPMRARAIKEIGADKDLGHWAKNIGIDGSGIEIRSPVLKGQEGIEELAAMFKFLNEKGSTVTNQDGMHVHHGAADFNEDWPKLYNLCASWGHWTPTIHKMVAHRRRNGGMCADAFNNKQTLSNVQKLCLQDKEAIAKHQEVYRKYEAALNRYYNGVGGRPKPPSGGDLARYTHPGQFGGRGALNLSNLRHQDKTTIEIRLAEGMMDTDSAVAWVKFGQRFLDHVAETGTQIEARPKQVETLLKTIKLDEDAIKVLKAKADNRGNALVKAAPGKIANGVDFNDEEPDEST